MSKPLLFFTDVHISKSTIKSMRKSCWSTVEEALLWIANRAKEVDAECIICGGDVTEKWDWSGKDVYSLAKIFDNFHLPVHTIIGNHDVPGDNMSLFPWTGLGQLIATCDKVKLLENPLLTVHKEDKFAVFPYHWEDPKLKGDYLTYPDPKNPYISKELLDTKIKVLVSHASITPDKCDYGLYWKDLKIDPFYDFGLFGDIHNGFGPHKMGNTIVGNPGAVYRKGFGEINNKPGIFLVYPDKTIKWEAIPVDSVEEQFYVEANMEKKEKESLEFKTAIAAAKRSQAMNIVDLVKSVSEELKYSNESTMEVLKRL